MKNDNFLSLYYRVDVEALNDWATVNYFMRRSIGLVVQEPYITDNFKQFLIMMHGSNWEKKFLAYQTSIIEQLYLLITGYGELASCLKRAWLDQPTSWPPIVLRAQVNCLAESGRFLEIEKAFGLRIRWRGINLLLICIQLMCQYCFKVKWRLQKKPQQNIVQFIRIKTIQILNTHKKRF